jgi:AsmA protein
MSRVLLILIGIVLLLIIGAAVLVPMLLDKDKVVAIASEKLQEQSGATLEVRGDVQLSIFPTLGVSLTDASLTAPKEQDMDLQVGALDIGVQLIPLLSGRVEIDSIALDRLAARITQQPAEEPEIDTSGMSDEELEALYETRRQEMAEAAESAGGTAVAAAPLALKVGRLVITDSRVELVDAESGESTVIELDNLLAQDLNLDGRTIPVELQLRVAGEQPVEIAFDGRLQVTQASQTATIESAEIDVTGATAQPVSLRLSGPVDIANQVADLKLALDLGEARGDGTVRYAAFESPQIDASLKLNLFDPALLVLAGPEAAQKSEGEATPDSGDEPLPLDALRAIDTRADLQIDKAVFDAHTIHNLKVELRAVEGDIQVSTLTGQLHGGNLDMTAGFNARLNRAKLDTTGVLTNLDIPTALAALESEPLMTGTASLSWTLKGGGRTANELIRDLSGPVKLTTDQVVLKDAGLEKMFCQAVALANQEALTAAFPADSALRDMSADVKLDEGKAKLNPLRIDITGASLRGKGKLDLLSQDFEADFDARISPELGELDPACRVNQRYTDLDWPVECEGNLSGDSGEWCKVDTGDILEQLARQEAKRKIEKEAGKFIDKLFK